MTKFQIREANLIYWIMYGETIPESWSDTMVESFYRSNIGALHQRKRKVGFEHAWASLQAKRLNKK